MRDRRHSMRIRPAARVGVKIGASQRARVVDISPSGARLEILKPLTPGGSCRLDFRFAEEVVSLDATVTRCRAALQEGVVVYAAGVRFQVRDAELVERLEEALVDLVLSEVQESGADDILSMFNEKTG